jgi:metacaspase-1
MLNPRRAPRHSIPPPERSMAKDKKSAAATKASPKALSLHIGLNGVSAAAYGGWDGPLAACEFDANDMAAIARSKGMKPTVLLTKKGTRSNVLAGMRDAATALAAGDLFFLTYSGHGGQVPDVSGDEADKQDETWCLYDGQLIDDELYFELSKFKPGVRILVLSDSCHSGTVTRAPPPPPPPGQRAKLMPAAVAMRVYREHQAFYDKLQLEVANAAGKAAVDPDTALANVVASGRLSAIVKKFNPAVLLISGCQDNQTSMDGDHNGAFTEQVLKAWSNGTFKGNYGVLYARIKAAMPPTQTPNLFTLGTAGTFLAQTPFTV